MAKDPSGSSIVQDLHNVSHLERKRRLIRKSPIDHRRIEIVECNVPLSCSIPGPEIIFESSHVLVWLISTANQ